MQVSFHLIWLGNGYLAFLCRESGEEYITASDIINHLGLAFKQIKSYQV